MMLTNVEKIISASEKKNSTHILYLAALFMVVRHSDNKRAKEENVDWRKIGENI